MRVIPPLEVTAARLTSSTVPDAVAATYSGATPYALGDLAGAATTYGNPQSVFRSLQAANTGNAQIEGLFWTFAGLVYPVWSGASSAAIGGIVTELATDSLYESLVAANNFLLTDATKWKYIGKTNKNRMFDYSRSEPTVTGRTLTIVFAAGKRINSIGIKGMKANAFDITVTSVLGGGTVYTESGSLNTRDTQTWSDYFFGEFGTIPSLAYFDIPPFTDAIVTITLTSTSSPVEIGAVVFGTFVFIGRTIQSTSSDVLNFSRIDRDEDGNAILTPRRNVPKSRQQVLCKKLNVNKVIDVREKLNGTPALWYGLADSTDGYFDAVTILGIYKAFEINTDTPLDAIVSLVLEEV